MKNNFIINLIRKNFLAGLVIILPAAISIGIVIYVFGGISSITDKLLFFLPIGWTHRLDTYGYPVGSMYWYWSLVALLLAVILISVIGWLARYYFGKRMIQWTDNMLMQIPLLNKIYGAVKQINEAFSSNKSAFKQVVMVPFPHPGVLSMGFLTGEHKGLGGGGEKQLSVMVPTTPNPTSGFLVIYSESEVIKLDIPVSEGMKFILSLGSLSTTPREPEAPPVIEKP